MSNEQRTPIVAPFPTAAEKFAMKAQTAAVICVFIGGYVGSGFLIGLGAVFAIAIPLAYIASEIQYG